MEQLLNAHRTSLASTERAEMEAGRQTTPAHQFAARLTTTPALPPTFFRLPSALDALLASMPSTLQPTFTPITNSTKPHGAAFDCAVRPTQETLVSPGYIYSASFLGLAQTPQCRPGVLPIRPADTEGQVTNHRAACSFVEDHLPEKWRVAQEDHMRKRQNYQNSTQPRSPSVRFGLSGPVRQPAHACFPAPPSSGKQRKWSEAEKKKHSDVCKAKVLCFFNSCSFWHCDCVLSGIVVVFFLAL